MRQRSKLPGNGGSHPASRTSQPEHQGKLVTAACWLPTELTACSRNFCGHLASPAAGASLLHSRHWLLHGHHPAEAAPAGEQSSCSPQCCTSTPDHRLHAARCDPAGWHRHLRRVQIWLLLGLRAAFWLTAMKRSMALIYGSYYWHHACAGAHRWPICCPIPP